MHKNFSNVNFIINVLVSNLVGRYHRTEKFKFKIFIFCGAEILDTSDSHSLFFFQARHQNKKSIEKHMLNFFYYSLY